MRIETIEDAIEWMVKNPGTYLYDRHGSCYHWEPASKTFESSYSTCSAWMHGPYDTEKPKPVRTIEESLKKLKGQTVITRISAEGTVATWVSGYTRGYVCLPTLQAALSALVDEIEDEIEDEEEE